MKCKISTLAIMIGFCVIAQAQTTPEPNTDTSAPQTGAQRQRPPPAANGTMTNGKNTSGMSNGQMANGQTGKGKSTQGMTSGAMSSGAMSNGQMTNGKKTQGMSHGAMSNGQMSNSKAKIKQDGPDTAASKQDGNDNGH